MGDKAIIDNTESYYNGMKKIANKWAARLMSAEGEKALYFDNLLKSVPLRYVRAAVEDQRACCDSRADWVRATLTQRRAVAAQWLYDECFDTYEYWKKNPQAYEKYLSTLKK